MRSIVFIIRGGATSFLLSLISSLLSGKVTHFLEKIEKRTEKSEENKKKKPHYRVTFLFVSRVRKRTGQKPRTLFEIINYLICSQDILASPIFSIAASPLSNCSFEISTDSAVS